MTKSTIRVAIDVGNKGDLDRPISPICRERRKILRKTGIRLK